MSSHNNNTQPSPPPLIFIFDQLRTRSHLFHRFLSTHPSLTPLWHPYIKAAYFGPDRHIQHARNSAVRHKEVVVDMLPFVGTDTYESCGRDLEKAVDNLQREGEGRMSLLANEHCLNILQQDLMFKIGRGEAYDTPVNPTALPDPLYNTLAPIILIRNPLRQIRSAYVAACANINMRPGDEDFHNSTTLSFSRFLFDDFKAKDREPIVVDGDDVLWRTREVAEGVCQALGLDASLVKDTWEPIEEGYGTSEPLIQGYMADVLKSTGVKREGSKPAEPDMETEVGKWREKFGDEVAEQLKEIAEKIMPDYEYLRRFKV